MLSNELVELQVSLNMRQYPIYLLLLPPPHNPLLVIMNKCKIGSAHKPPQYSFDYQTIYCIIHAREIPTVLLIMFYFFVHFQWFFSTKYFFTWPLLCTQRHIHSQWHPTQTNSLSSEYIISTSFMLSLSL